MSNAVQLQQSPRARKPARRVTRFVRASIKPVVIRLSRRLSMTFWPRRRRTISQVLAALLVPFVPTFAGATPTGGHVVAGSATITRPTNTSMQILQGSQNAIINWQSFSIGSGEAVRFVQPNASSVALNRVIGGDPSRIFGSLSSNGQVFLVNGAGVYFAPGAKVDVGGLVATSMNVSDANFMAGKYRFEAGANAGSVANYGELRGAYVVLGAPQVTNAGSIDTTGGSAALAAGGRLALDIAGDRLISLNVDAAAANAAVVNSGSISAGGGKVFMTANSANAVLDTVINTSGIVRATSIGTRNGQIVIDGGGAGVVAVSGTLDASGTAPGTSGGTVKVLGDKVGLFAGATVDVSGDTGGGTALIGGNFHGAGAERNAAFTEVDKAAVIRADATGSGNGGKVAVWSDQHTRFQGSVSAQGGALGGDGGFVETSGKQSLAFAGKVDTQAAKGKRGTLLLDPTDIAITTNPSSGGAFVAGTFSGSGATSELNVTDLTTALGSSNVIVDASAGAGAGSGNITVDTAVTYNAANSLTLKAAGGITVNNAITNSGSGGLALNADGAVALNAGIGLAGGTLSIAGAAGGSSKAASVSNTATLSTGGGNVDVHSSGQVTTGGINSGAGTIAISSDAGIDITGTVGSSNATTSAIMLNAGAASNAGNASGGDITVSGGGVSVSGGGRATLYTGSVAGSSGLASAVGTGSGHFRYNSDAGASNFTAVLGAGVYGIYREQPILLVTPSAAAITYGDAVVLTSSLSGLANGDTSAQALTSAPTVAAGGAVSTSGKLTAGTHTLTVSGAVDQLGYFVVTPQGTLTVAQKAITIGGITVANKVYDGTSSASADYSAVTMNGLVSGDAASISGVSASFADKNAAPGKTVSLVTSFAGADAANYTAGGQTSTTADITPKNLTVSGLAVPSRIYNGTANATIDKSAASYAGLISGDDIGLAATGSFADKNVGTGKAVTIASTYSGADAGNYNITGQASATGDITPKDLFISGLSATSRVYDGTATAAITGTTVYNGLVGSDDVQVSVAGAFDNKNVGTGKTVTLTSSHSGADAGNYNIIDQANLTADITHRQLTVTGITVDSKIYDGTPTAVVNTSATQYAGMVAGDDVHVSATGLFADKNVGVGKSVALTSTPGGVDAGNYTVTYQATATGDITQKELTFSGITAANKTYDGTPSAFVNTGGVSFIGLVPLDVVTVSANGQFVDKNAANGKTVNFATIYGGADAGNYHITGQTTTFADITPKPLTISGITADSKIYDGTNAATVNTSAAQYAGLIDGDDVHVSATGTFVDKNAAPGKTVTLSSSYAGSDASNYVFTSQLSATTDITRKQVTVSGVAVTSKVYDGGVAATIDTTNATIDGVIAGDVVTFVGSGGVFADKNVGTGKAVTLSATYGGADRNNYDILDQASATGTITRLGSVTWVGGASGNWSVPTNWAGGAIPDMANVSQVVIPAGSTVNFDSAVAALNGAVRVDAIDGAGALALGSGALNVANAIHIGDYAQSAGTLSGGALSASSGFGQTGGSITLSGGLDITQTSGSAMLGNIHSASLNVASPGGVSQAAGSALIVDGTATLTAGAGDINLSNVGNDFNTVAITSAHDVVLTDTNALAVSGSLGGMLRTDSAGLMLGATTVGGTLDVTSGAAVGQSGALNVGGLGSITAAGDITLADSSNAFHDALKLNGDAVTLAAEGLLTAHLSSGDATLTATGALSVDGYVGGKLTTSSAGLSLGTADKPDTTTVIGNLFSTSTGAVGQTGALTVHGSSEIRATNQAVILFNGENDFIGDLTIQGGQVRIADKNALSGQFAATNANLVINSGALVLGATSVLGGNLAVTASGAVTQTGALTVTGSSIVSAPGQDVVLGNAGNDFRGDLILTAGSAKITDSNALSGQFAIDHDLTTTTGALAFGASHVGGDLDSTAGGAVTQTGALTVTGTGRITAAGQDVTLTNAGNDFGGMLSLQSASADVAAANALAAQFHTTGDVHVASAALALGESDIRGDLSGTTTGAVTQSGSLLVHGATKLTAGGDIVLANSGNDFMDKVSMTGANINVADLNALDGGFAGGSVELKAGSLNLGDTSAGILSVTSAGAVTQYGALRVTGDAAIKAAGQSVTLDNANNDVDGRLEVTADTAQLHDKNALSAHLTTSGAASVTAGTALTLDGTVGTNLQTSSAELSFGATTVFGKLDSTATGAVGQTGALFVAGTGKLDATGQAVDLRNADNDFRGALTLTAGNAQLADKNALSGQFATGGDLDIHSGSLIVGTSSIGGKLSATVAGDVTQDGTLAVTGTSGIDAGTHSVTLSDTQNSFLGALTLGGGAVDVAAKGALTAHLASGATTLAATGVLNVDGNAASLETSSAGLSLGALDVAGNLTSRSSGAVGQGGALTVHGTGDIMASGQQVVLDDARNDFFGKVTVNGGSVRIADKNALAGQFATDANLVINSGALALGATSVGGILTVNAGGAVTQNGALKVMGVDPIQPSTITASGQSVSLDNSGNDFRGDLILTAGSAKITDSNALSGQFAIDHDLTTTTGALAFGASHVGGDLVSTAGGAVTQTGALIVTGTGRITAAGQDVTLTNAGNAFGGMLSLQSASADVAAANALAAQFHTTGDVHVASAALALGESDIRRDLSGTTTGAVSQSGALLVHGATNLTAGGDIVLANAGNDFTGTVSMTGANINVADLNALDGQFNGGHGGRVELKAGSLNLGDTSAGILSVTSAGAVKQYGALVTGDATIDAAGQVVTLDNAANDVQGRLAVTAATAQLRDKNALTAHLAISGAASVTAGAALTVDGTVGANLQTGSAALSFGTTSVAGVLASTATGAVSQTGALTVAGASTLSAAGQAVDLRNSGNDFGGALTLSAASAQLADKNALTFGASKIDGALAVTAGGDVTQSGALTVAGASAIDAGTHAVVLTDAGNDIKGAVSGNAGSFTLNDTKQVLTAGRIKANSINLSSAQGMAMIQDGLIDAPAVQLSMSNTSGSIGSVNALFAVRPGTTVTFGASSAPVSLYFSGYPLPVFVFANDATRQAYSNHQAALYVDNKPQHPSTDGATSAINSEIAQVLQASQKKADSYTDLIREGLPLDLTEQVAYPHAGSLAIKAPACPAGACGK